MKILKKIFFLLILSTSVFAINVDVLFYVQDAGETNFLKGVFEELENSNKTFLVISEGTSKKILENKSYIRSFEDLGIDVSIKKRDDLLTADQIQEIQKDLHPKIFVSSVAYLAGGQLIEALRDNNVETISIWDNFNATGQDRYFSTALKIANKADIVVFPSDIVAKDPIFKSSTFAKAITGQPAIEEWIEKIHSVNTKIIKEKLQLKDNKKILTYIGGNGYLYEKGFKLFIQSLQNPLLKDYQIVIARHPKMTKGFEEGEIKKARDKKSKIALPNILVIQRDDISTIDAVAISDLVVCHQSTAGFLAIAAQKNVIFLVPENQKFSNLAIDNKLAMKTVNTKEFISAMQDQKLEKKDFFETLKIPKNAKDNMISIILYRLSQKKD